MRASVLAVVLLIVVHPRAVQAAAQERAMDAFAGESDRFIRETLSRMPAIPGVAIAVVKDGAPAYLRGFGMADVERGEPMTAESLLYIASNTKSFTALAAAVLEHRGVLALDDPLTSYLPCAPFPPPTKPGEVTLRDLLTHTSGMVNDPLVFRTAFSGEHTPELLMRLLRRTTVNQDAPRGKFSYTNTGYLIAAMAMREATGTEWQDLLRRLIFRPLGMSSTTARAADIPAGAVVAAPYRATGLSTRVRVALEKTDQTLHPAGGIFTSGKDLARWLSTQMSLVPHPLPRSVIDATHVPQVTAEGRVGPFTRHGYALGWIAGSYGNEKLLYHLGTYPGANSLISFVPERKLGVAVFVNEDVAGVRTAMLLTAFVYDWWLRTEGSAAAQAKFRNDIESRLGNIESLPEPIRFAREQAKPLLGTYESPEYGTLLVSLTPGGVLHLAIGAQQGPVIAFEEGKVRVPLRPGRPEELTFVVENGRAVRVNYGEWGVFYRED